MTFLFLLAPSRPSINSHGRLTGDADRPPGESIRRAGTGCAVGAGQDRLGSGVSGRGCPQVASPHRHRVAGGQCGATGSPPRSKDRGYLCPGGCVLGCWGSTLERPPATCWLPWAQPPERLRVNPCPLCPVHLSGPLWPCCLLCGPAQHGDLAAHLWLKPPCSHSAFKGRSSGG